MAREGCGLLEGYEVEHIVFILRNYRAGDGTGVGDLSIVLPIDLSIYERHVPVGRASRGAPTGR